jgi:hypothetical protein
VPKRTNLFQEVVTIVHEHLAEGSTREPSAMLENTRTGFLREVDVVLRVTTPPGYETVIAIEATKLGEPADVTWVEQMVGKHKNLRTDKVVLVSDLGFSAQARILAIAENMIPLTPEVLESDDDPALSVLDSMRSLWPKHVTLTPQRARVDIDVPGSGIETIEAPWDLHVYAAEDDYVGLLQVVKALIEANWVRLIDDIELANIAESMDAYATVSVGPGWTVGFEGEQRPFHVERTVDGTKELLRIDGMTVWAKIDITVSEIQLHRRRLAGIDVDYAFGEGFIGVEPVVVVVTEGEHGRGKLSIKKAPAKKKA